MKKIGFSGTLDPITNGHMWVISEARALADEVTVFLSENPFKKPQFPAEQRQKIIEQSAAERGWHNVRVVIVRGDYTARAAKKRGIDYLIRGIRNTADFDYENLIQQTNVDVLDGAKTLFVMPPRDLGSVSSSFVRALQGPVGWHWSMRQFVPPPAYQAWIVDWLHKEWNSLWPLPEHDAAAAQRAAHWFDRLTGAAAYGGSTRRYHNLEHLVHGLTEIAVWAANAAADIEDVSLLKKAFWFHDAVYDHGAQGMSDEEASAQLWLESALDAANSQACEQVAALIRATDHFQAASVEHRLKDVMLGADLAILGQSGAVYDAYARAIRQEYASVPEAAYRAHRAMALRHLLQKAQDNLLFADASFSAAYTGPAIGNLTREIAQLEAGVPVAF